MEICDSAVLHNDIFINGKRYYIFYSGAHLFCQLYSKRNSTQQGAVLLFVVLQQDIHALDTPPLSCYTVTKKLLVAERIMVL